MPRCTVTIVLVATGAFAQDPVLVTDASSLRDALAAARPGTSITVAPGDYGSVTATNVRGTSAQPIRVRAAVADRPPVFTAGVHLIDVEHLVLENLHFVGAPGNGLNIDDGGTFDTPAHHVVLRDLVVRDLGGTGNHDGIKLSGVVDFTVTGCTIERWGRGGSAIDMVGCARGRIEHCTIRDREQAPAASGVQMKGGTRDIVVHRCHFDHAGQRAVQLGGSTGMAYFRPKPAGFEAKDLVVEGCTFTGATAPVTFVGCDGAKVRWNTFDRPGKWLLRILQETREPGFVPCRNGEFTDNLIVWQGLDVIANVGPDTAPDTFTFARNRWHRLDAPDRSVPKLPVAERDGVGIADPRLDDRLRPTKKGVAERCGAHALPRR